MFTLTGIYKMRQDYPDELTRFFVTALAVFVGGTAALFANDSIRAYRLEVAAVEAMQELQKELVFQGGAAQATQAAHQAQLKAQADARLQAQLAHQAKQAQQAQQAQQAELERQRVLQLRQKRQEAWENFYQPRPECRDDPLQYSCANEHIRALNKFNATYKD